MSLWNRSSHGSDGQKSRGIRRIKPRQARNTERLEPKVVLGSMIPTETGTMVGSLIPIETVDLLSPGQYGELTPADIALMQSEQQIEQVRQTMADLDLTHETQLKADSQAAEEAAAEAASSEPSDTKTESTSEAETTPADQQQLDADADIGGLAGLLALANEMPLADVELTEGEDAEGDGLSENEDDDDDDSEDKSEVSTDPADDAEEEAAKNENRAEVSEFEGSANSTSNSGLTSAGGSGPVERADGGAAMPVTFMGQSGSSSPFGTDTQAVYAPPVEQATGFGERPFNPDAVVIQYDFRGLGEFQNQISAEEIVAAESALYRWEQATDFNLRFEQAPEAHSQDVVIIYKGDLAAVGYESSAGEVLGVGGTVQANFGDGTSGLQRVVVVDGSEQLDTTEGDQFFTGTFDFQTIVGHEIGHVLGVGDPVVPTSGDIMNGMYDQERGLDTYEFAAEAYGVPALEGDGSILDSVYGLHTLITGYPQLTAGEVAQTLAYATTVTPSNDAIIAIVDRQGRILGVRVEDGVNAGITGDAGLLAFSIDGAVAKARTAAFFANGDPVNGTLAPITSRLVRFISQTTNTFRDVNSNPNLDGTSRATALASTTRGPGTVGPIGVGGHFPPEIFHTPPVDLFDIEHTNTDTLLHPGVDGVIGTGDDVMLEERFNVDPAFIVSDTDGDGIGGDQFDVDGDNDIDLRAGYVESFGVQTGTFPIAQPRGIATLPGGVPIYRDTNGDGVGETLIGAVGVFFPGPDGTADFEQNFQAGIGQTERERLNAPKVLEAEFIATVAAGGSTGANAEAGGAKPGNHPVQDLDIPFGRLDLVGIQLEVIGPIAGILGVQRLIEIAQRDFAGTAGLLNPANLSGTNIPVNPGNIFSSDPADNTTTIGGQSVPFGWLVAPHDSNDGLVTAADVTQIVQQGLTESLRVRAAIRLPLGSRTRMVYAVTALDGELLGLFRQRDATIFSIDVAVGKARNVAYYADASVLQPIDQIPGVPAGAAFTSRTFRFLAEPRFPSGVDDSDPNATFSILTDVADATGLPLTTAANKIPLVESQAAIPVSAFDSIVGNNAFFPSTNLRDPDNILNQNNVVFFPGSTPIYDPDTGALIGGFGVSGDGVDQDDVVTFFGAQGFLPPDAVLRADEVFVDGVRLPYQKFLRNPHG